MWYIICFLVGLFVGGGLMWWFGVHKKKIPNIEVGK